MGLRVPTAYNRNISCFWNSRAKWSHTVRNGAVTTKEAFLLVDVGLIETAVVFDHLTVGHFLAKDRRSGFCSQFFAEGIIGEEDFQCRSQLVNISRRHEQAVGLVFDQLGNAADVRTDRRAAAIERLLER